MGLGFAAVFVGGLGFGQVEAGDLEAVEEQAGAAGVDVVGGDALEDLADGGLDGGAVFGEGQVEGGAAAAALARVRDGFAGGVVVVAELFLAEAWAGAAVSVGEDVAALVLLWCFVGVVSWVPSPRGGFLCKVFEGQGLVWTSSCRSVVTKGSGCRRTFSLPLFKNSRSEVTHTPSGSC